MNNLRFSVWTFRVTNNLDFREIIMRLAQLLPSILMMLFVVDLDKGMPYNTNNDLWQMNNSILFKYLFKTFLKNDQIISLSGTHIRLYVKAAPIENRLKFQPNTTNHSDNSSQFFFANIPQSSVHTQANISSNNLTNEALNTTSIVQTVPSASESTASRIALTSFDTYPIGSISAIDSEAEPTNSHLNTSFDLFIKWLANASLESSEVNMTNAELLSNWTFGADNSSAILAFSGGNSSVDNSTSDFTFATATNQSEGESESGFFGTTRLTTAESLPLPTVTPPISNPSVYTATSTPESSPIAFTSTAADTSQQSQVEVEATASNLQRDLDSALLQHQLNTAFGILLGGHSPLTRSGSSTTSDNGLRSGYTPQPETVSSSTVFYCTVYLNFSIKKLYIKSVYSLHFHRIFYGTKFYFVTGEHNNWGLLVWGSSSLPPDFGHQQTSDGATARARRRD